MRADNALTCLVAIAGDMPRWRAAAERLPSEVARDEGVLVVGSGMSFHNMRGYGDPRYTPLSARFDAWLTAAVESATPQREALLGQWVSAPHARDSHPPGGEEHLLPLMVAAGAGTGSVGRKIHSEEVLKTTLSAFRFD